MHETTGYPLLDEITFPIELKKLKNINLQFIISSSNLCDYLVLYVTADWSGVEQGVRVLAEGHLSAEQQPDVPDDDHLHGHPDADQVRQQVLRRADKQPRPLPVGRGAADGRRAQGHGELLRAQRGDVPAQVRQGHDQDGADRRAVRVAGRDQAQLQGHQPCQGHCYCSWWSPSYFLFLFFFRWSGCKLINWLPLLVSRCACTDSDWDVCEVQCDEMIRCFNCLLQLQWLRDIRSCLPDVGVGGWYCHHLVLVSLKNKLLHPACTGVRCCSWGLFILLTLHIRLANKNGYWSAFTHNKRATTRFTKPLHACMRVQTAECDV